MYAMFGPILRSSVFWISIGVSLGFTLLVWSLLLRSWRNRFAKNAETVTLDGDALREPMSAGITTSGLVLPLAISLIAYLAITLQQPIGELAMLFASVVVLAFALLMGVFNLYGPRYHNRCDWKHQYQ